jgi:hypothetical protein
MEVVSMNRGEYGEGWSDDLDIENVVAQGGDEAEDLDAAEAAFLRGYLGMVEV